jgi:hypothetical protein
MEQLDAHFDPDRDGPDREGSNADALRHCIGACMANHNPGPCLSRSFVRARIQARENASGLNHDMDRANNVIGFGIAGDCVKGCTQALEKGRLSCFNPGDTKLSPCKLP